MVICRNCGRDLDDIGEDNVSATCGSPLCESCANDEEGFMETEK